MSRKNYKINPKTRLAVLKRDGFACVDCGCTEELTMDHIKPRSKGGDNTFDNLQTMCVWCNSAKGAERRSKKARKQASKQVGRSYMVIARTDRR